MEQVIQLPLGSERLPYKTVKGLVRDEGERLVFFFSHIDNSCVLSAGFDSQRSHYVQYKNSRYIESKRLNGHGG